MAGIGGVYILMAGWNKVEPMKEIQPAAIGAFP